MGKNKIKKLMLLIKFIFGKLKLKEIDRLKVKGELELKFYKDGVLIKTDKDHNLITNNGYTSLFNSLSGNAVSTISKVQLGTNTTAANKNDTAITTPVDLTIVNKVVSSTSLVITFSIGSLVANNVMVSEFGLITSDNKLFSRRTVTPFLKIQDLSVEGTWTIKI